MWAYESVFYQIYPLGFCNGNFENDGICRKNIKSVIGWSDYLKALGVNALYFSPVFESDTHGYNTRDYRRIDARLGSNEDFVLVCDSLHEKGFRIILDGVFNHVGRGFWAFQDVLKNRENSPYVDWFSRIDFGGNSPYNDGLWYEGWEGNYDLVKLNLRNEAVISHIFSCIEGWVREFDIDGLRLDVAYCLDLDFLRRLRAFSNGLKPDFFLLGETLFGDYNRLMNDEMLHSVTNYECYKGLHSSFNSGNLFEINHSLLRQFGADPWTLYRGKHLLSFVDNHDVTRVASILNHPDHLPLIYALMFGMPGIPCIYYGSEWGTQAKKEDGDPALRPCFDAPLPNQLTGWISLLAHAKLESKALQYGDFSSVVLTNLQCVFARRCDGETVYVCINSAADGFTAHFSHGACVDLIDGREYPAGDTLQMPGYSAFLLRE